MKNPKKKILMLLENSGMPEDVRVRNEAVSLVENGFEVCVICPNQKKVQRYENYKGVHLYRYPAPAEFKGFWGYVFEFGYSLIMAFVYSLYVLFRRGFHVVHVHAPPDLNCFVAIFYKLFFFKKFVLDTHDLSPELYNAQNGGQGNRLVYKTLRSIERIAVRWSDHLITTNQSQQMIQSKRCGKSLQKCCIVRNGPNKDFVEPADPTTDFPKDNRIVLGYVGVIGIQDGVDALIRALAILQNELGRKDFHAVIVGYGNALESIQSLASDLGIASNVTFTGRIPFEKVSSYIAAFDICVTPDPSNPYNDSCTTVKTIEYMAQGKPVVSFETPENRITAMDSGIYAADNNESDLARCIQVLMDDSQKRDQMGQLGKERVLSSLSWMHQEVQLLGLYQKVFGLAANRAIEDSKIATAASLEAHKFQ